MTQRGRIIRALQNIYGDKRYEYWNAGVESFNTMQEVVFYRRYNYAIDPDHVILTFHQNDFQATPAAFFNSDNRMVVYSPNAPLRPVNRWLFGHS